MVIIMGTVRVDPARLDAARPAMAAMVEASRAEVGCRCYAYSEDVLEPGLIRVSEQWADREALDAHFKTPHMAVWRAAFAEIGISDRRLEVFDAGEPGPI